MPQVIYDNARHGIDRRKGRGVSDADRLWEGKNVYITTGWKVRKRPGLKAPTVLESGTVGLVPHAGKHTTFYHNPAAPVSHANPLYVSRLLRHPTNASALALTKIHHWEIFNGFIYLAAEFSDGNTFHFYLDDDGPWSALTEYRFGAFRRPTADNGLRYELTATAVANASFSVAAEETLPQGMAFKTDGTKLYVLGSANATIYQYPLSTPWLISTAGAVEASFSVAATEAAPTGIAWKSDGTKVYITGTGSRSVHQFNVTVPWSTADIGVLDASHSVATEENEPQGIAFKTDGTILYVVGSNSKQIRQYPLTAWDLTTVGALAASFDPGMTPRGIAFRSDGTRLFVIGDKQTFSGTANVIHQYPLTPAWQLTTIGALGEVFSVQAQETMPSDVTFRNTGTRLFVLGSASDSVLAYNLATPWTLRVAGTSGASEPAWPLVPGATVVDGTVIWTARSKEIRDANCPNHPSFTKAKQKIWSPNPIQEVIRFCSTDAPRDWSAVQDAGFLPTGLQAAGDPQPKAVARHRTRLAAVMNDSIQLWDIDTDPVNNALAENIDTGTDRYRSFGNVGEDLYLLTPFGFRTVTLLEITGSVENVDAGSPIDELVLADIAAGNVPIDAFGLFFHGGSQYWCIAKKTSSARAYIFSWSRISKLASWSYYDFAHAISDASELNNILYLRAGNNVFEVSHAVKTDNGVAYETDAYPGFQHMKKPGQLKFFVGADFVMEGPADISYFYDAADPSKETTPVTVVGDTRSDGLVPVEIEATEIAPRFKTNHGQDWRLDMATFYYDVVGPVT